MTGPRTLLTLALLSTPLPPPHPADGPDIDVRVTIADGEVRVALLMNLAFVDRVVRVERADPDAIATAEHERYQAALLTHFESTNKVTIDGVDVAPLARGFEVQEADLGLLPLFPRFGARALFKLQLTLGYPTQAAPHSVALAWGAFPPDAVRETDIGTPPIDVRVHLVAKGLRTDFVLTHIEPEYVWHDTGESLLDRFETVPTSLPRGRFELPALSIGLACLGAVLAIARRRRAALFAALVLLVAGALTTGVARVSLPLPFASQQLPSEIDAITIFEPLHANVYRAFDYLDESDVYDALARSVTGPLLDRLYGEIYRTLIVPEEGGAISEIQSVRPLATTVESIGWLPPDDVAGFTVRTRWQVEGAVFHWGHGHRRTNEYEARYTVMETGAGWRIRDYETLGSVLVEATSTESGR